MQLDRLVASFSLMVLLGTSSTWAEEPRVPARGPLVSMSVTLPDGRIEELTTHESGLATVKAAAREYGFRPTMHDDAGRQITITIFEMGTATEPIRELAAVELAGGGTAVASNTTPVFQVRAHKHDQPAGTTGGGHN